jgi:uncharacterized protein HemX
MLNKENKVFGIVALVCLIGAIVALFAFNFYATHETVKFSQNETIVVDNLIMQKNAAIRKLSSLVEEKQKEIESARKELDSAKKELDALRALQTLKNEPKP